MTDPRTEAINELEAWWANQSALEAEGVIPKAIEYGSHSLTQYGRMVARLQGREVDDEEAQELGCWMYLVGKVERWSDAVLRGERPSGDTLHDAGVYIKMAQRIRVTGSWPGQPRYKHGEAQY